LAQHLAAQQGITHRVLTEGPRMGRTEQFTEVDTDQPASDQHEGIDGERLVSYIPHHRPGEAALPARC
jgi:hypothetical protein